MPTLTNTNTPIKPLTVHGNPRCQGQIKPTGRWSCFLPYRQCPNKSCEGSQFCKKHASQA